MRPALLFSRRAVRASTATLVTLLAAMTGACRDAAPPAASATPVGGTMVISALSDADLLMPPLTITGQGLQVVDAVFDRLAQPILSDDGVLTNAPALATDWSWRADSLAIDFTLDSSAAWHDGVPLTANDVRFTWLAYTDSILGSPARSAVDAIDSVQVVNAHAVRVWFARRSPSQFDAAAAQMRILPQHLLDTIPRSAWRTSAFARQPVGSGRFRFVSWQAGTRLEIVADSGNYRGRPKLDRVVWTVAPDPAAATMRFMAGDADFIESVRPDAAAEFVGKTTVRLLRSPSLIYGYVQFNLLAPKSNSVAHPLFGARDVRRAISQAVDRSRVVRLVFDSLARVALGPVTRIQLGTDTLLPALPFDTVQASRELDALGWRATTPGGIRERNGVPLAFTILVPSTSIQRVRIATIMQPMLRAVGVEMRIESLEFNTFMSRLAAGDFDAAVMAMGADVQLGGIRGVWSTSAGRQQGGPNFGSYASATFDQQLERAAMIPDAAASRRAFADAYATILDDAPAIWLYEPYALSGISTAITPVGVRPDGWWLQLGDWFRTPTASAPAR